jgi:hypothetical protein
MDTINIIKLQFNLLILRSGKCGDFEVNEIILEAKLRRQANPASGAAETKLTVLRMRGRVGYSKITHYFHARKYTHKLRGQNYWPDFISK